ncbi:MAG: sensor histidine kinase [Lachnospiraceae bacterium]|jgi:two-component system sensor histidine kinase YesM|nr:sensor histidine kinase [Lachnospiraceae bacterium]
MKIMDFYSRLSIKYKFLVPVTTILFISYTLILGYTIYTFQTDTKRTVQNQIQKNICDQINYFNRYLHNLNQETDNLLYGTAVQQCLIDAKGDFSGLPQEIRDSIAFDKYPLNMYLEDGSSNLYVNNTIYSSTQEQYQRKKTLLIPHTRTLHGKMYFHYFPDSPSAITMARTVYKLDVDDINQEIGFFICDINTSCFSDIFGYDNSREAISYILTDADNQVIVNTSAFSRSEFETMTARCSFPARQDGIHIYKYATDVPQLKIYAAVNQMILYSNIYRSFFIQLFMILLSLFLIAAVIYLAVHNMEQQFTSFIQKIASTNQIDSQAYITVNSHDEFAKMAHVYNDMLGRIHHLIQTVYEQKLLTQRAELEALHSQINPHFLYNTLDSISSLIDLQRPRDAQKALFALASIMRMSIKGPDILSIGEELAYIREYLFIQKMRFGGKVLFLVDVPEELSPYSIPKLCIQPLIENSLIHGVRDMLETGMVAVSGEDCGGCIRIRVRDNGIPIPGHVKERLSQTDSPSSQSIGLMNIQRRIQMIYGSSYGLEIRSGAEGNQVTIVLPKKRKEEESHETLDCGR